MPSSVRTQKAINVNHHEADFLSLYDIIVGDELIKDKEMEAQRAAPNQKTCAAL